MKPASERGLSVFEKYLTIWVGLCILAGIGLGKVAPGLPTALDRLSVAQVSIPIAMCLFLMMYPIMVKIDFSEVVKAGRNPKARCPDPVRQLGGEALYHVPHRHLLPLRSVQGLASRN